MWYAKPKGSYAIDSTEARANQTEIYNQLSATWSLEAICGMLGNFNEESGYNPWRWQNDEVDLSSKEKGYGLPQFTPAYGYIDDYGVGVSGFAPNKSITEVTEGASPSDGHAQIIVIDEDRARKFGDQRAKCDYADLTDTYPFSSYKQLDNLWIATVGWLFNYENPKAVNRTLLKALQRYASALNCYEYLGGVTPVPPVPPIEKPHKMPLYMYLNRKY